MKAASIFRELTPWEYAEAEEHDRQPLHLGLDEAELVEFGDRVTGYIETEIIWGPWQVFGLYPPEEEEPYLSA